MGRDVDLREVGGVKRERECSGRSLRFQDTGGSVRVSCPIAKWAQRESERVHVSG
jgi:hypothetical protein